MEKWLTKVINLGGGLVSRTHTVEIVYKLCIIPSFHITYYCKLRGSFLILHH